MENEFYYKSELQNVIEKFLNKEASIDNNEFGYIPDALSKNMAEAAYLVLKQNAETNIFIEQNK